MKLLKILAPIVILKKIYTKPYSAKKQAASDAEQDAIDDAKADQ